MGDPNLNFNRWDCVCCLSLAGTTVVHQEVSLTIYRLQAIFFDMLPTLKKGYFGLSVRLLASLNSCMLVFRKILGHSLTQN